MVTVNGFGFANITPAGITIGTNGPNPMSVTSRRACLLEFTNPGTNLNPTGTLSIATSPPVQKALCCVTPKIDVFNPNQGKPPIGVNPGTDVTVQGCGFIDVEVYLKPVLAGAAASNRITPKSISATADTLTFTVPAVSAGQYHIHVVHDAAPMFDAESLLTFLVQ